MEKKSKENLLFKIVTILCIAALLLIAAVGIYFIKIEKDKSTGSENKAAAGNSSVSVTEPEQQTVSENQDENAPADLSGLDKYDRIITQMSLHDKVCQMFIVTPESLTGFDVVTASGDTTERCLEKYPVGGLIYFAQNLETMEQAKEMLADAKKIESNIGCIPLFYGIDEEGGSVARCADTIGTTEFEPMYNYKEEETEKAYSNALTIAKDLSGIGFNLDFAPVADTWSNPDNTVIGKRAYSDDFSQTAELVASAVKGFGDGGVFCSLKHFPGHGDTAEDSHYGTATTYKTSEELEQNEYLAFRSGMNAGADMVMIGHITVSAIDSLPASVSQKIVTGELRGRLGYNGVVVTDSLAMGAVAEMYAPDELAVMAVEAGVDILLMPADLEAAVEGLEKAVQNGQLSEERINESVRRILELKDKRLNLNE